MRSKTLALLAVFFVLVVLPGCGSNRDSGGDRTAAGTTLADAQTVGITNCLVCHDVARDEWLLSRHGNDLAGVDKLPQDARETPGDDPIPDFPLSDRCLTCHDALGDGATLIPARPVVSCESCHGGGQFHSGTRDTIPFPEPGPDQCGNCHGIDGTELFHATSGSGNNVRRNISDTHVDDVTTTDVIEGYVVKTTADDGCSVCHGAHEFDLSLNLQWARSPHAGQIKDVKDTEMFAQLDAGADGATTLAAVKAVGATAATGDGWVHYDWDEERRQSCQRCHTSTGLMNFMADTANYDNTANDFSHLSGWSKAADGTVTSSGQNEMLYCWGCHSDAPNGILRDDPNGITLDFVFEDPEVTVGDPEFIVLPEKGNSDICGACHSGRGNNTSIRDSYAEAAAEADPNDRGLSSRFAGHHAPTAGSLYAAVIHTGFEFEVAGTPLDYTTPGLLHDVIDETGDGPCVSCHMSDTANHDFLAVTEDEMTGDVATINNQALCEVCHGVGGMLPADLNTLRAQFASARLYLDDLVDNIETNHLNLDISASANRNTDTLSLDDYGAFQNSLYMNEEPCIYLHNSLYAKRLIFDSIDWLDNGTLDGTIAIPAGYAGAIAWYGGAAPVRP